MIKRLTPFLLLLMITGCGIRPPEPLVLDGGPDLKIGLVWGVDTVRFSLDAKAAIANEKGTFMARRQLAGTWQAQVASASPGKTVWFLVAASMSTRDRADAQVAEFRRQGHDTFVYPAGQKLKIGRRLTRENHTYRVCLKQSYASEAAARQAKEALAGRLETFIIRHLLIPPGGTIRLTHLESGQEFASSEPIILSGERITLHRLPVGTGFHWATQEDRDYPGEIILQVGSDGRLVVINKLPLETYLQGVVPTEMPAGFPLEALKAQAVAARSEVLAKLGWVHTTDPFDLCADVHCQAYSGLSKRDPATDRAVAETLGEVLMSDEDIVDAVYSAVCGGHGESAEHAWGGEGKPYLKGEYDGEGSLKRYGRLNREDAARRFIDANPATFCNANRGRIVPAMNYTQKYFRWEQTFSQQEIRMTLERHSGRSVGEILELEPLKRGDSGRITQLRVEGRTGSYLLEGELAIRRALSATTLWSSCFYVIKDRLGAVPQRFTLKGAGFGHGVGMCQTGAAGMALRGAKYKSILSHYYSGSRIRRLY